MRKPFEYPVKKSDLWLRLDEHTAFKALCAEKHMTMSDYWRKLLLSDPEFITRLERLRRENTETPTSVYTAK